MGQEVSTPVQEPVVAEDASTTPDGIVTVVGEPVVSVPAVASGSFSTTSRKLRMRKARMNVALLHETLGSGNSSRSSRKSFRFNKDDNSIVAMSNDESPSSTPHNPEQSELVSVSDEEMDIIESEREKATENVKMKYMPEPIEETDADSAQSSENRLSDNEKSTSGINTISSLQQSIITDEAQIPRVEDATETSRDRKLYLRRKLEEQQALERIGLLRDMIKAQYANASDTSYKSLDQETAEQIKINNDVSPTPSTDEESRTATATVLSQNEKPENESLSDPPDTDDAIEDVTPQTVEETSKIEADVDQVVEEVAPDPTEEVVGAESELDWDQNSKYSVKSPRDARSARTTRKKESVGFEVVYSENTSLQHDLQVYSASSSTSSAHRSNGSESADPTMQGLASSPDEQATVEEGSGLSPADLARSTSIATSASKEEGRGHVCVADLNDVSVGKSSTSTHSSRDPTGHNASVGDSPELAKKSFDWSAKNGKLSISEFNDDTTASDAVDETSESGDVLKKNHGTDQDQDQKSRTMDENEEASNGDGDSFTIKTQEPARPETRVATPSIFDQLNVPNSNEVGDRDVDVHFVEQYEDLFEEFVFKRPKFVRNHSEFMSFLKIVKLQKILEATAEARETMIKEMANCENRKEAMSKSYHSQLMEASQIKAKREIELEMQLNNVRKKKQAMLAELSWKCVAATKKRAKNQQRLLKELTERRSRGEHLMSFLPEIPEAKLIKACMSRSEHLPDELMRETVHFQVDNALLHAETVILECHSQTFFQDAKKHAWVDSIFTQMSEEQMMKLKELYSEKTGVTL